MTLFFYLCNVLSPKSAIGAGHTHHGVTSSAPPQLLPTAAPAAYVATGKQIGMHKFTYSVLLKAQGILHHSAEFDSTPCSGAYASAIIAAYSGWHCSSPGIKVAKFKGLAS